jgi:plasmid segregation protein ParM
MIRTAAIDAGFDALKGMFGGLRGDKVYIPNVVHKMDRSESLGENEGTPLDELHVKVTSDAIKENGTFAVGTLASRFTTAEQSSMRDRKGDSDQTILLLLTAIAYDAAQNSSEEEVINAEYVLSTGLPIDESKIDNARASFGKKLKEGIHQVEFVETPELKGKKVRITFKDVFVNTEGHAAMVNITMDDDYKAQNKELFSRNILIDDMGGNTTDFAIIRKGKIDNEYSTGIPLGIGVILDDIIHEVLSVHRYRFKTRREIVENITSDFEPYIIRPEGSPISIKEIVDKHLEVFAQDQYKQLQRLWAKVGNLHSVYCVGGTSFLLKDFLTDINEKKSRFDLNFLNDAEESIWSIAKAYQKLLALKAKKIGYESKAIAL